MRVRDALLVLLSRGAAHGYQLKRDYERLTRNAPVNVGQVYQTLERLQRDGLVEREEAPPGERRVRYHATRAGSAQARALLFDAGDDDGAPPSTVVAKVLLATEVPGVDALDVLYAQRAARLAGVQAARRAARGRELDAVERLGVEAELAVAEAELRWLDLCEEEIRGGL